jgi:Uncharacterised nucleotidyltransferase
MRTNRERTELLGRCLALRLEPLEVAALRAELMATPGLWPELTRFALDEGLLLALEQSLRSRGLLISEILPAGMGFAGPDTLLLASAAGFAERRRVLARHLIEIIARLNLAGIEPIVIKGAQSLLTGDPPWRYLRDFDLLIPDKADEAQQELIAMGFGVPEEQAGRGRRHHLPPLVRDDFPAFVEIHRRAGNQYVRTLLPTQELARHSELRAQGDLRYRILPQPLHVLYSLVHHHIGHAGDARGTISLKGLYEFAWEVERMSAAEREALRARANRHPRLACALDSWVAAAQLYRMPVEPPLTIQADAVRRWEATLARLDQPRPWYKYPGYPDEIRMGLADSRIRAAPFGGSLAGRAWTRLKVTRSFLPRFTK